MNRRELLAASAVAVAAAGAAPLAVPTGRSINVAFLCGAQSNLIDIAGPAEVFQDTWAGATLAQTLADTHGPYLNRPNMPFAVYTVAESADAFSVGPRLRLVPSYTLANSPRADVIVVGAQSTPSAAMLAWLRHSSKRATLTMSVCTGAFVLAAAGLLDGRRATTHHAFYDVLSQAYPKVQVVRGTRYVDDGNIASAGGLTSGIDLALHVVARFFGETAADETANWMEFTRMTQRPSIVPS